MYMEGQENSKVPEDQEKCFVLHRLVSDPF